MFALKPYFAPDFSEDRLVSAPDAKFLPAPFDGVEENAAHATKQKKRGMSFFTAFKLLNE